MKIRRGITDTGVFRSFGNFRYLFAVEQELAVATSTVIIVRTIEILGNVYPLDPYLTPVHNAI